MSQFRIEDVFVNVAPDYYRIPVAIKSKKNLVLFANRRLHTASDNAEQVHVVFKRSSELPIKLDTIHSIFDQVGWNSPIGSVIDDPIDGRILLLFHRWALPGQTQKKLAFEEGYFIAESKDHGEKWIDHKMVVLPNHLNCYGHSHGASSGVKIKHGPRKGRIVVPARFFTSSGENLKNLQKNHYNCALFSDDNGHTWQTSEPVQAGTGEGGLVELSDGRIYYNSRAYFLDGRRRIAWSYDGGETFTDFSVDKSLTEPLKGGCNAGMVLYPTALSRGKDIILFSNPAGEKRECMTVRASLDGGLSWPVSKLIYKGPSAYSSMTVGDDGTVFLLYENGVDHPYEKISLAEFNLQWLMKA